MMVLLMVLAMLQVATMMMTTTKAVAAKTATVSLQMQGVCWKRAAALKRHQLKNMPSTGLRAAQAIARGS